MKSQVLTLSHACTLELSVVFVFLLCFIPSCDVMQYMHPYFRAFQLRCASQTLDKVFIEEHREHGKTSEGGEIN
jgi:hypothetical protein